MAMIWKVKAVDPEAAQDGVPWEPFGVSVDTDGNEVILCKTLVDVEGDKSSVFEENRNWAGNEPDAADMDLDDD